MAASKTHHERISDQVTQLRPFFFAICCVVFAGCRLNAQYLGDQQMGIAGLKAGSQPDPGFYVTIPLYYRYSDISFYNAQGNKLAEDLTAGINLFVLPAAAITTPFKIFGAHYGASYTEWISNGVVSVDAADFHRSTSYGFGDLYVQPLILGWHLPMADVTTGYSFFAPTGAGSSGFHMWVNEINFGSTLYSPGKKWNVSTMSYWDFNNRKNNTDIKVGNILTLAGGIGRSFLKGVANAGVAYGTQWKLTHDSGSDIPPVLPITNGRAFAVGPQIDLPVFAKLPNLGLLSFRYMWVVGPKTALGGQLLIASFTFARLKLP
jgi:hypothetical protein